MPLIPAPTTITSPILSLLRPGILDGFLDDFSDVVARTS